MVDRSTRLRTRGANLLLAAAALVVVFALSEVAARIAYRPENLGTVVQFDAHLGWSLKPNSYLHSVDSVHDLDYTIRVNSLGMREREFDVAKRDGVRRILFVGDSFAFGVGVDAERRCSDFVGRALDGGEVVNAAVCGWGTDQELIHYERVCRRLDPDVVVLTVCMSNDVLNNMLDHIYLGTAPKPRFVWSDSLVLENEEIARPKIAPHHRLRGWLKRSRLLVFARRRIELFRRARSAAETANHDHPGYGPRDAARAHSHWSVFERDGDAEFEAAWRVTEALIARFARDTREDGAAFVVLAFPLEIEVDDAWRRRQLDVAGIDPERLDIEKPFDRLEAICRRLGVAYVHPLEEFREANRRHRLYFDKDVHPNAYGHAEAAREVLEVLESRYGVAYHVAGADRSYIDGTDARSP